MNILQIKKINFKLVALSAVIVVLSVLGLWSHFKSASGAQGDPEAQMQDLSGTERTSFSIGETGYINLRGYSEILAGYKEKLDIVIVTDTSGSMCESGNFTKFNRAKQYINDFVDDIKYESDVDLGIVHFRAAAYKDTDLTNISSQEVKDNLKGFVSGWDVCGGATDINEGADMANEMLIAGRPDATKYVILITDGGENPGPGVNSFINGSLFNAPWINNINANIAPNTTLADAVANDIRYISIVTLDKGVITCPDTDDESLKYNNCGLMRFIASKTNGISMPAGAARWNLDFGQATGIDDQYVYLFFNENINGIYQFIEGTTGVKLGYFLKLAPQTELETVYSAIDKGGRSRAVSLQEISPGTYRITTNYSLPESYKCTTGEESCTSHAVLRDDGSYWVEENYLDIKLRLKFTGIGTFDLLSNYIGCESGPLKQVSQDSGVESFDPRDDTKYKTLYFKSVCVRVAESSPSVIKTSYATDPGDDLANPTGVRQASFDAGDDVWIVLEIDDSTSGRTDFTIGDQVPASVSGAIEYSFYHGADKPKTGEVVISSSKAFFKGQDSGDVGETIGGLSSGKNYIKYKFKI